MEVGVFMAAAPLVVWRWVGVEEDSGIGPAGLGPRLHHKKGGVRKERIKVLPVDSWVSITSRYGSGTGSHVRVSTGEAGVVEGSEEDSYADMHILANHLLESLSSG